MGFLTIGRSERSENTPRQAAEEFSSKQHSVTGSEEYDEDKDVDKAQGDNHYPSVTIFRCKITVEQPAYRENRY